MFPTLVLLSPRLTDDVEIPVAIHVTDPRFGKNYGGAEGAAGGVRGGLWRLWRVLPLAARDGTRPR